MAREHGIIDAMGSVTLAVMKNREIAAVLERRGWSQELDRIFRRARHHPLP
jgi:hypothetical protein